MEVPGLGETIPAFRPNQNPVESVGGARSSRGGSITAMGFDPAVVSEPPGRPTRKSLELEEVGADAPIRPVRFVLDTAKAGQPLKRIRTRSLHHGKGDESD
jgi:hypothetical protein